MGFLPKIQTKRLLLRPLEYRDAPRLHALETDAEVKKFLGGPSKSTVEEYANRIKAQQMPGYLAVTTEVGEFLGRCGFLNCDIEDTGPRARFSGSGMAMTVRLGWEIHIALFPSRHREGYGREVAKNLINYGFNVMRLEKLFGVADAQNAASLGLCEQLGFRYERDTTRHNRPHKVLILAKP